MKRKIRMLAYRKWYWRKGAEFVAVDAGWGLWRFMHPTEPMALYVSNDDLGKVYEVVDEIPDQGEIIKQQAQRITELEAELYALKGGQP